jgi:hypothetical protein
MANYDPSKDIVAGRTAKQIEAAKRRAVRGGGRKKCKKGKSCGATCINGSKVCLVDLPWVSSNGLSKVATKIQSAPRKKKNDKEPAVNPGITLSPLNSYSSLMEKMKETNSASPELVSAGGEVNNILHNDEDKKYVELRDKVGKKVVSDGGWAIAMFSEDYNTSYSIRMADRGAKGYEYYKKEADDLNRILTLKEMPKPEVEKFRGFRATNERLQEMIEGAKNRESFITPSTNSWSSSLKIGQRFANRAIDELPERDRRVIFRTINKRGVPIREVSAVTHEEELMTPRNTRYRYLNYTSISGAAGIYHIFDVEEMS